MAPRTGVAVHFSSYLLSRLINSKFQIIWVHNTNDYNMIKESKEMDDKAAGSGWSCVYIRITCWGHICSILEFTADLLTRN